MAEQDGTTSSLRSELQSLQSRYTDTLTKDEALDYALEAAELHMKFLRLAKNKTERVELGKKTKSLLDQAERIKSSERFDPADDLLLDFEPLPTHTPVKSLPNNSPTKSSESNERSSDTVVDHEPAPSTPQLGGVQAEPTSSRVPSDEERTLLLKVSARVNGTLYPPFTEASVDRHFDRLAPGSIYTDSSKLRMSEDQLAILDAWKRPAEALPPPSWLSSSMTSSQLDDREARMKPQNSVDLVQDAATDCSIVASLSAAIARSEKGFPDIISTVIRPYDTIAGSPIDAGNGMYVVRLNFNGCNREVVIDDRLPVSNTSRILHVVDRNNPQLLWPALLEKAYLKVRGGYDFPGSNSGTDLGVLTGWIPEQIFLHRDETDSVKLWTRVQKAFTYGDVLVTLGTAYMTTETEHQLGLAGEHDYAVIDMEQCDDRLRLLIKNPWLRGTAWKDYHVAEEEGDLYTEDGNSTEDGTYATAQSVMSDEPSNKHISDRIVAHNEESMSPGTFWMDVNKVMQNFESLYLNWNPNLFKYRQDVHFRWDMTPDSQTGRSSPGSMSNNPQFVVKCNKNESVWLLLTKHFTDTSSEQMARGPPCYISLYVFDNGGTRSFTSKGAIKHTPYVDSPQTLLIMEMEAKRSYTIALSEQDLPSTRHVFTLTAFSRAVLSLEPAQERYAEQSSFRSSWTEANAGGNASSAKYSQNPQFQLRVFASSMLCMTLETTTPGLRVHAKLLHGQGKRVFSITNRDIIMDTGDYRKGYALAETKSPVPAGVYTIICSNFDAGQLGDFTLRVLSDTKTSISAIPREGAGRIRQQLADASFPAGCRMIASPLSPQKLAVMNFTARYLASRTPSLTQGQVADSLVLNNHSPLRLTVDVGRGPERQILISSGQGTFSDDANGIRTDDVTMRPEMAKRQSLWLVLERMGGSFEGFGAAEERVTIDMFSDAKDPAMFGVWRTWD